MKHLIEQLDRDFDWHGLPEVAAWTVERAVELQQIPAPTFEEARRADHVAACFKSLGLAEVNIDGVFNVYGLLQGASPYTPGLMISAHTDTVFPADTDLKTRVEGSLIWVTSGTEAALHPASAPAAAMSAAREPCVTHRRIS